MASWIALLHRRITSSSSWGRQAPIARAVAPVLVAVVFWFDTVAPAGAAVPVLYVAPILLFIRTGRFWEPLLVAFGASGATIAGAYLTHHGRSIAVETLNLPLELAMTLKPRDGGGTVAEITLFAAHRRWRAS
jgi:hypothetical protein